MDRRRYRGETTYGRGQSYYSSITRKRTEQEVSVTTDIQDEHQFPQLGVCYGNEDNKETVVTDVNYGKIDFTQPVEEKTTQVLDYGWVAASIDSPSNRVVWKDHKNSNIQLSSASLAQKDIEWGQKLQDEIREHAEKNEQAKQEFLQTYGYELYKKHYMDTDCLTDIDDEACENDVQDLDDVADY